MNIHVYNLCKRQFGCGLNDKETDKQKMIWTMDI